MGGDSCWLSSGARQAPRTDVRGRMTTDDVRPFQLLYASDSSPGTSDEVVAAIGVVSTQQNLASGISGALLFDGRAFCQLLEGAEPEVRRLMAQIMVDPRHRGLLVGAAGYFGLPRLTTHWRFGHCTPEVMEPLTSMPRAMDEVALALFMSALASAT